MIRRERSSLAALFTALITLAVETRAAADPRILREGAQASPARRIVVSLAECRLAVVEGGAVVKVFRTAVGAPKSPSPVGTYRIINRISNPTYFAPGKVIQPGPANPLGTRWLGLSADGYGIHGTNQPQSIGRAASHGCIRLRNNDVEELFRLVRFGDQVEIVPEFDEALVRILSQNGSTSQAPPAAPIQERN